MSRWSRGLMLLVGSCWASWAGAADESAAVPPGPTTDRIVLSADGATLKGTNGGLGGSITYLHQEGAVLAGVAAEYQRLAIARWGFGSFNIVYSHDLTAESRWNVHAEAHEGTGSTGGKASRQFLYSIEAGGVGLALPGSVGMDVEERQIDVANSHGSLPKLSLSKGWGTHFLTTVGYARSVSGNLNTSYSVARIDFYGPGFGLIAGGDVGRVNPAVINLNGVLLTPQARHLDEVFGGVTKSLQRVDLTLLADRIDLGGISRLTITLNCSVPLQ